MHIRLRPLTWSILFICLSNPVYPMSLRDIKLICKRTSNYQRCIKDFSKKKISKKKDKETVIRGPIPIKIIPYKEK